MTPPMSWERVWSIVRHVKAHYRRYTSGQRKYLFSEITRMDEYQRRRFRQECGLFLMRCPE